MFHCEFSKEDGEPAISKKTAGKFGEAPEEVFRKLSRIARTMDPRERVLRRTWSAQETGPVLSRVVSC